MSLDALLKPAVKPFDVFISMKRVEWDTLMFFYGIMLCVGGLAHWGIWPRSLMFSMEVWEPQQRISLSEFSRQSSTTFPSCLRC